MSQNTSPTRSHARATVDLNADIGERPTALDEDRAILRSITSANVACGYHAGNADTMRFVCMESTALGVAIGAHVSYLDREGFGRRELQIPAATLAAQVREQITMLREVASDCRAEVRYVKPHGAMYNQAARDPEIAAAVVAGVAAAGGSLPILSLPGSELAQASAAQGLEAVPEGFADRAYLPDGSLAPRSGGSAVLGHEDAVAQALAMATGKPITTAAGSQLQLTVRSLCLHSDTPGAVGVAAELRRILTDAGVEVEAFT
jgi:5-oxoprolinase (ATP-hydrolysing) subunit A